MLLPAPARVINANLTEIVLVDIFASTKSSTWKGVLVEKRVFLRGKRLECVPCLVDIQANLIALSRHYGHLHETQIALFCFGHFKMRILQFVLYMSLKIKAQSLEQ